MRDMNLLVSVVRERAVALRAQAKEKLGLDIPSSPARSGLQTNRTPISPRAGRRSPW